MDDPHVVIFHQCIECSNFCHSTLAVEGMDRQKTNFVVGDRRCHKHCKVLSKRKIGEQVKSRVRLDVENRIIVVLHLQ